MKIGKLLKLVLATVAGFALIEGCCPRCGIYRVGWALLNPRHQTCPKCGEGLKITENGQPVATGYSPFHADKYVIKPPDGATSPEEKSGETNVRSE